MPGAKTPARQPYPQVDALEPLKRWVSETLTLKAQQRGAVDRSYELLLGGATTALRFLISTLQTTAVPKPNDEDEHGRYCLNGVAGKLIQNHKAAKIGAGFPLTQTSICVVRMRAFAAGPLMMCCLRAGTDRSRR
ncbi:hypothetical protein W823_14690 [Williamsia sp. D3]|nr:hypothetical protein W823_14690 [Williamsia sp. D3]